MREKTLLKALAVNPKDRYSNIGAFQQMFYGEFMPMTHIHTGTGSATMPRTRQKD